MKDSIILLAARACIISLNATGAEHKILVGVCNKPENAREAGFDYCEMAASSIANSCQVSLERLET